MNNGGHDEESGLHLVPCVVWRRAALQHVIHLQEGSDATSGTNHIDAFVGTNDEDDVFDRFGDLEQEIHEVIRSSCTSDKIQEVEIILD